MELLPNTMSLPGGGGSIGYPGRGVEYLGVRFPDSNISGGRVSRQKGYLEKG